MLRLLRVIHEYGYALVIHHFFLVWVCSLILIVALGLLLLKLADGARMPASADVLDHTAKGGRQLTRGDRLVTVLFIVFLAAYISMIFYRADFALYDDSEILTDYSVRGTPYPPHILWADGRFIPLAFQEFNVLGSFTHSVAGYYSVAVVQLIILLLALYIFLEEYPIRLRFLILGGLMVVPSFVISFTGLIFPERDVLFWLAILLLCLHQYSKTKAPSYFLGTLVAAHFAVYYKEPVVALLAIWAVCRVLIQLGMERSRHPHYWRQALKDNLISAGTLAVCSIYTMLFVGALFPRSKLAYLENQRNRFQTLGTTPQSLLMWHLVMDWLPLIMFIVLSTRVVRFALSRGRLNRDLDALAAGGLAYYLCILVLRIGNSYYTAPIDLLSVIYLASISFDWLAQPSSLRLRRIRAAVVSVAFALVIVHNVLYSSFEVADRKSVMTAKARFADFLKGYLPAVKSDRVELFFPYSQPYDLMGFSAYLRYRGFRLEGPLGRHPAGNAREADIVIEAPGDFAENKCVPYRDYVCHHADFAPPGSLVVMLPDDDASMGDLEHARDNATLVFDWEGLALCGNPNSWCRWLHAVSIRYPRNALPEHWPQLQVFRADGLTKSAVFAPKRPQEVLRRQSEPAAFTRLLPLVQ